MNEIAIKSKLLSEYLGWFYVPHNSLGDLPKAGWYKNVPMLTKGSYKGRKYICRSHNDLRFYNSYDWLFEVVRKLEKEDVFVERIEENWVIKVYSDGLKIFTVREDRNTDLQQLFYSLCAAVEYINKIKNEQK